MDRIFQRFQSAPREELRLRLALEGCFSDEAAQAEKREMEDYLHRRVRAVMELLLREGQFPGLEAIMNRDWLTPGLLEDGLTLAVSLKSAEGFVLLLRWKAEKFGFADRDFSL